MTIDQKTVMITLTENCNLSCSYCYEHNKTKSMMKIETAKEIIDYELKHCSVKNIEFDLFGGEPFLNLPLIKEIDSYLKEVIQSTDLNITIFASTNGTLIHGDIQDWLEQRNDYFICGLSYDGTNLMQDLNRCKSSSLIDLDFFRRVYPNQSIKMTVSCETLPYLAEGVIYLHKRGFDVVCNLAYNIDWANESYKNILESELAKLIQFYLENPSLKVCSMLDAPISHLASNFEHKKYESFCGAGTGMIAYDIIGNKYPCQFFMPLSVGQKKVENLTFYGDDIPENLIEAKCRKCAVQVLCPTCYGANYAATGDMYKHDKNYCELTKVIIKARSFFRAKQWELGKLDLSQDDEILLLKSIKIIQENL